MKLLRTLWVALATTACVSTSFSEPLAPPAPVTSAHAEEPSRWIFEDSARHEIHVVAGPFHVPAVTGEMDHHGGHHGEDDGMKSPLIPVAWPVDAGLTGFRFAVWNADGEQLPRDIMHHAIAVNFNRRQLVYPVPERIFGFGTETPDVKLPDFLEVPLERGDSIGFYAMWNNRTGSDLHSVFVHLVLPYAGDDGDREAALPVYFDTNNNIGGKTSFDLPPGHSSKAYEFELPVAGGLLAASGHLHDYGVELRLEEVETGRLVTRLEADRAPDGHVTAVEQRIYRRFFKLLDARVPLEAGVRYRVVGIYDNPTGKTIPDGGMAHIVGLFVPEDAEAWPDLDRASEPYRIDVEALPEPIEAPAGRRR